MQVIFLLGMTNAGKSTFIEGLKPYQHIGAVEVGKLLRAKYPPSYFEGSMAPAKTAVEAMAMCQAGITEAAATGRKFCIVDGQPRDIPQAKMLPAAYPSAWYWCLHAPRAVRLARAVNRDPGTIPPEIRQRIIDGKLSPAELDEALKGSPKLELSIRRMTSDYSGTFEVLAALGEQRVHPVWLTTEERIAKARDFLITSTQGTPYGFT